MESRIAVQLCRLAHSAYNIGLRGKSDKDIMDK